MKRIFLKKAIFGASVVSLTATMVFAVPAFAGADFDYESGGANYRYPSQRDYSQGSTSPYRHYQPDFNRSERDSRYGASEFPQTGRGNNGNLNPERDFGSVNDRGYSEGSTYGGHTGYRGYRGNSPDTMNYDQYYQGRYGRPSYRNYRENMQGRNGADNPFGGSGRQEPYGQSRRQRQFEQREYYQRQQMRRGDQIQGRIKEIKTVSLSKMDEDHVIARIRTQNGQVAKVDLGPEPRISDLNLQKGDQVTVRGITGSINQKPVLMAHAVEAKGQRVSVKRPQDLNLKSYSGQIIKTKKTSIRKGAPTVLMARIRMDDGNTAMVNMGPEKELRNRLDIQEGKRFSMLARPAKINGRTALVAEFVKIGDNSVDVDWQKAKKSSR